MVEWLIMVEKELNKFIKNYSAFEIGTDSSFLISD